MKRIFSLVIALLLLTLSLPICASAESALDGKVILAFGDSLTQGTVWWVNSGLDTYPSILKRNFPNSTVINAGVRGDSTYNATLRFQKDVLDKNPDIVLICFGMNDQAWDYNDNCPIQSLDSYRRQLVAFIVALRAIDADVVFVTPNPVYKEKYTPTAYNNYEYGFMDDYCNEMREIALEYGCGLVDMNYEINQRGISTYVSTDGIHQTEAGHSLYAECITNYLKAVYDGTNRASATVNYKTESGKEIGTQTYVGAAGANIILATPAHLGTKPKSEDIAVSLVNGAKYEMTFDNAIAVSKNKKYTTTAPNRNDSYDDDGLRLSDGLKSNKTIYTGSYSGWNKTESGLLDITFDLGEPIKSNVYKIYVAGGFWGISIPAQLSVSVSSDGINFSDSVAVGAEAEKVYNGILVDGIPPEMYCITATAKAEQNARYVRLTIKPQGAHVWIDEAEVLYDSSLELSGENPGDAIILSKNKKYTTDAPNRNDGYDDDGVRLANGIKGNKSVFAGNYSGWAKTEDGVLDITFDLGEITKSNVYKIYVADGFWGITAPAKLSVLVSNDGVNFSGPVAVCETPEKLYDGVEVEGNVSQIYCFTATARYFQNARYVRLSVTPQGHGFIWIDEAEVICNASLSTDAPEYALGDVNADGTIDQFDYILVKRHYFETRYLTDDEKTRADVNLDGAIDQFDYILIKRIYFGTYTVG